MTIELVDDKDIGGRPEKRRCLRCKKTAEEILRERPNLSKVFWRKGYCDPCFHKMGRKCRNKGAEKNSATGKGFRIEQVVGKALEIKNCNLELDNFNAPLDLYDPVKYKKIQVRSAQLKVVKRSWKNKDGSTRSADYIAYQFSSGFEREYDNFFVVCMSEGYKDIDDVFIIPVDRLPFAERIYIYIENIETGKNIKSQYEDCKLDKNGELFNKIRDTFHSMKIDDCPVIKNDVYKDRKEENK